MWGEGEQDFLYSFFFRLCLHAPSSFSSFLPIKAYMCFTFMRRRRGHRPDFHGVVMNSNVSPSGGAVTRISPPYFLLVPHHGPRRRRKKVSHPLRDRARLATGEERRKRTTLSTCAQRTGWGE